jgi:hypothetical protein
MSLGVRFDKFPGATRWSGSHSEVGRENYPGARGEADREKYPGAPRSSGTQGEVGRDMSLGVRFDKFPGVTRWSGIPGEVGREMKPGGQRQSESQYGVDRENYPGTQH